MSRDLSKGHDECACEVTSERIRAGVRRTKESGKQWGGKKVGDRCRLTDEKLAALEQLLAAGTPKARIARQLGVSEATVYRAVRANPALGRAPARKTTL